MALVPIDLPLTETPIGDIEPQVARCREAFDRGTTRPLEWRRSTLERLRALVVDRTDRIQEALASDLGKPGLEGYLADILTMLNDLDHTLAHLPDWMRPERVPTTPGLQPGSSRLRREPLGVALVIAPWNYPVALSLSPAVAAIAAGNAVVIKPSEIAEATAVVLGEIVEALDDPAVAIVQGGVAETTELLALRFDHIFYTGNGQVGRIVMRAAAEHLTPVTLELGGKSPAIVTAEADIEVTARRLVWGKFANAGQTCIAPDYVLVERSAHDRLVDAMVGAVRDFYGDDPSQSEDYARIVSTPHFHRIEKLLDSGTVAIGGETDVDARYVSPTILTDVARDAPVMAEEIFGPVLAVLAVDSLDEATAIVRDGPKPLALYVFTEENDERDTVIRDTSSGGVVVNATLYQFATSDLPFGGVGDSGMGVYHGKWGFHTFSHLRPQYERSTRVDPAMLYPPITEAKQKLMERALKIPDPRLVLTRAKQKLLRRS